MKTGKLIKLNFILLFLFSGIIIPSHKSGDKKSVSDRMVLIPAGSYSPLKKINDKIEKIKVNSFYIDKYPVTNAQYLEFVRENPEWRKSKVKKIFADVAYLQSWKSDLELGPDVSPNSPVTNVSWFAARAFAKWCGKRLPTLDEWEYAASAGRRTRNLDSEQDFKQQILDWYSKPNKTVRKIGSEKPNYYGVFDLYCLGWEWVDDFNSVIETGDSRNGNNIDLNLFCASGSAGSINPTDYASFMRYAFRSSLKASYTISHLGFRCVKDISNSNFKETK